MEKESLIRQNEGLVKLNAFAIEMSKLTLNDNYEAYIAKQLKQITGAVFSTFNKYDAENKVITIQHVEMEPGLLERVIALLGKTITQIKSVVSEETYAEMTKNIVGYRKTLHEASFGDISRPSGFAIEALLRLDRFIGIAYLLDGKLYGTSVIALRKEQPDPLKSVLENFANFTSAFLRRRKTEEVLRDSEATHIKMIANIGDVIVIIDAEGINKYKSANIEKWFGWKAEDVVGCSTWVNVHPDDLEKGKAFIGSLAGTPGAFGTTEVRYRCKNGSYKWIEVTIINLLHDKLINGFLGNYRDITARKETEAEYSSLLDNMLDAYAVHEIICDDFGKPIDYRYVAANKAFEQILGMKAEAIVGKTVKELIPGIESFWIEKYGNVALTGESVLFENFSAPLNKYFEIKAFRNKPNHFVTIFSDISERKKSEADKEKLNNRLNQMQKMESLGVFAGGIAHDFNNLLQGIFASIEVAKIHSKEEKANRSLNKALETIGRASNLSQQLLTFAKGGAPVKKVGPLFPLMADAAKFALSGSQVSCSFNIADDLWNCNFDENQLGQVVDNIVINAQQAMPLGGKLDIYANNVVVNEGDKLGLKAGKFVKLSIRDYGTGIPSEHIPKIFDPFFTTKTKGHGLGLPTCYSIVTRHDGIIEVESEVGKGSVFHIYIPAVDEMISADNNKCMLEHKGVGRVLLMDDEEVLRETIGEMLQFLGYTVMLTSTGEEAVETFKAEKAKGNDFSALIFDLTVPGSMGGTGAIEQIRKICKNTPAIVMSGYSEKGVVTNPGEFGFNASLHKPFSLDLLGDVLSKTVKTVL
ncbi:MAG: PAS domain S-box protein [Fibrobacteres bacterium]|nr:PAS domain S-box protein [Fibrobacterota bacterium]